ncbi:glycosyltransferase family 2 protein [Flavobacteriaceae bacterium MHTCC 0001]
MVSAPIVSIITATYNSEAFIEHTIKSVLSQSYKNWELIIIDDASSDTTRTIVTSYCEKFPNITFLQNKTNQGAAAVRNRGIDIASGDFIAFLDGDDLWKPNKLETQVTFMLSRGIDVSFSSYDLIDDKGNPLYKTVKALPKLTHRKLLRCNYIGNLTGMYNVKTLGKILAPNLRKRQDWLLWLEALKKSKKPAMGIQESLALYRVRENSMSSKKINLLKYNYLVYRKGLKFSTIKSIYSFVIFLFEHFIVKSKQTVNQ